MFWIRQKVFWQQCWPVSLPLPPPLLGLCDLSFQPPAHLTFQLFSRSRIFRAPPWRFYNLNTAAAIWIDAEFIPPHRVKPSAPLKSSSWFLPIATGTGARCPRFAFSHHSRISVLVRVRPWTPVRQCDGGVRCTVSNVMWDGSFEQHNRYQTIHK